MIFRQLIPSALVLLALSGCAGLAPSDAKLDLKPASFKDLPGWEHDTAREALAAFRLSCARILKQDSAKTFGVDNRFGTYADWQPPCRYALALPEMNDTEARQFFERAFTPYLATGGGRSRGLFTGYYEASLNGSLTRGGRYQYPLLARPDDLVMVDLGEFRDSLKGQRIAGRVKNGQLKPYEDRGAIENGKLPEGAYKPLVYVDDPVDAFFLHVQGSGQVTLPDGKIMRVGYAGQNGHVYYAIGRELVKRGAMKKEDVSMQSIRGWLAAHPDQAREFMNLNPSYVFFKALDGPGPLGGEGVPLTAGRSLAIDRARIPYGLPLWVDIAPPREGAEPLQRLMMAQDTGGAITGPVRGDFYWGHGPQAEDLAGIMKSEGRYWLLLPRK